MKIPVNLKESVKAYYMFQNGINAHPVKVVTNKYKNTLQLLLVRFKDIDYKIPRKMSSLMTFQEWADGHWDVSEVEFTNREDEQNMVDYFVNSYE